MSEGNRVQPQRVAAITTFEIRWAASSRIDDQAWAGRPGGHDKSVLQATGRYGRRSEPSESAGRPAQVQAALNVAGEHSQADDVGRVEASDRRGASTNGTELAALDAVPVDDR
jgi:hypothetical protein